MQITVRSKLSVVVREIIKFYNRILSGYKPLKLLRGSKINHFYVSKKIWVVNARVLVRQIVRKCIPCFRFTPKMASQIMADLPKDRVTEIQPFYVTGVDLCGPVFVTLKRRGKQAIRMYKAMFVCFAFKAVHLETVNDLSTDSFVCSLNTFIGRTRGRSSQSGKIPTTK